MRFFKYLVFIYFSLFTTALYSAEQCKYTSMNISPTQEFNTLSALCSYIYMKTGRSSSTYDCRLESSTSNRVSLYSKGTTSSLGQYGSKSCTQIACPSATEVTLKVSVNAQKYQCVNQCQYALRGCVDIDFEPGMTCSAISTGIDCGGAPPKNPADNSQTPDENNQPAAPNQNSDNTNSNTATSTGTSTSTSTSTTTNNTTNNTSTTNTTTTTNTNTTTKIDLSSLESAIRSLGSLLGGKLDAIKDALGADSGSDNGSPSGIDLTETNQKLDDIKKNGEKTNNWLQGKNEDGTGGGVGDNPFGTDVTPERVLDAQSFKTNIFQSNAQCPADKTLSMTLFTGRTFTRTLSFSMWCDKLAIFGSLILIVAYLYGASIIVRNS